MRAGLLLSLALGLAACNANPLLKSVTTDYSPLKVGSHWVYTIYTQPSGSYLATRTVMDKGVYFSRQAWHLRTVFSNGLPVDDDYQSWDGVSALDEYNTGLSVWEADRRLPYVNGNRWPLPSTTPNVSYEMRVEGLEKVVTLAGTFEPCFKLKVVTSTYSPALGITTTADASLTWAAPGVGDVKYATLDAVGNATTVAELGSYQISP